MYAFMMKDIGPVSYSKCPDCGFTASETHHAMAKSTWEYINNEFHRLIENPELITPGQPPYIEQAAMMKVLSVSGIIDGVDMVDYAGGYGTLSNILDRYFRMKLPIYDPYIQNGDRERYVEKKDLRKYKTLINSALFEHLRTREEFNGINDCVTDDGCMIVHTVICERIPKDPNWFYLDPPVHCAFHTNRSMELLIEQWGYQATLYCPRAKCWVLLKKPSDDLKGRIEALNMELQTDYLIYRKGFVDYWKGF